MKFLNSPYSFKEANVVFFGVPIGKRFSDAIKVLRQTPVYMEDFDIESKKELLEGVRVVDAGDLKPKSKADITKYTRFIVKSNKIPVAIAGDHPSLFTIPAFTKDIKVISFDAHCDLKDEYEDDNIVDLSTSWNGKFNAKVNGATWLRRLSEIIDPKNILLIGVRSCDAKELKYIEESGIMYISAGDIHKNQEAVRRIIQKFTHNEDVYITLDVDVFDPSIAPAVHQPEPDGIYFSQFKDLLHAISGSIVGFDVCCLKPIKGNQITEFLTTKALFEILSLVKK
ncbi:arginase family protein [Patescibacteria group bacterium]|nr:arginase family protein [Patescibacteria group bacterium]